MQPRLPTQHWRIFLSRPPSASIPRAFRPTDMAPRDESGFVLIAVIGILLLLAILVSSLTSTSSTEMKVSAARTLHSELQALADGMARLTAYRLAEARLATNAVPSTVADGEPLYCRDGKLAVEIRIRDVNGLIDINYASVDLLEILLRGVGVDAARASRIAAAIVDFRDPDDIPLPGGAEAAEYAQAQRPFGPKNAPFETTTELDQVLGMTPELLSELLPLVTVHARSPRIDPAAAPLDLLQALTRGKYGAETMLTARDQFKPFDQIPMRTITRSGVQSRTRVQIFAIQATVAAAGDGKISRNVVVELMSSAQTGLVVREWAQRSTKVRASRAWPATMPTCETAQ